jgi:hypothetical protein
MKQEKSIQYSHPGGEDAANKMFDKLSKGSEVQITDTPRGPVKSIELKGGGTASMRGFSNEGSATIQINRPEPPKVKHRFGNSSSKSKR